MLAVELNVVAKVDLVQNFVVKGCVAVKVTMMLAVEMHVIYVLTFIVAQTKIYTSQSCFPFLDYLIIWTQIVILKVIYEESFL